MIPPLVNWRSASFLVLAVGLAQSHCKPQPPMCTRVQGRWQGQSVEGGDPAVEATLVHIMRSVRWTIAAQSTTNESGRVESMRVLQNDANTCKVELTNDRTHVRRTREMVLSADGLLHANTVGESVRIVLRRVSE